MSDEEIRQLIASNAKAIQALTVSISDMKQEWQKDREEWKKDRRGLYELLGRLTRSMSDFYEIQSDFYRRFDQIDERQEKMTRILKELTGEDENPERSG
ncbi:hypothetical protein V0288_22715 [Pannus brasiliensis CCIBt3594]|uniref:WXG100 family type VII secretion target n=1 Tax=Pannus brasiliensis CCIBt3594 TaxID=1427578 RepID=A0AAW9R0T6_9CHRO